MSFLNPSLLILDILDFTVISLVKCSDILFVAVSFPRLVEVFLWLMVARSFKSGLHSWSFCLLYINSILHVNVINTFQ